MRREGLADGLILDPQTLGELGSLAFGIPTQITTRSGSSNMMSSISLTRPTYSAVHASGSWLGIPSTTSPFARREPLRVVATERHDDDVGVPGRQQFAEVRRPVEEVGPGKPRRHLVVGLDVDDPVPLVGHHLEVRRERAGVAVADHQHPCRVVLRRGAGALGLRRRCGGGGRGGGRRTRRRGPRRRRARLRPTTLGVPRRTPRSRTSEETALTAPKTPTASSVATARRRTA